jgi:hypothetical protein
MEKKGRSTLPYRLLQSAGWLGRRWLVNDHGKYEQTMDHAFLNQFFEIKVVSEERSLYGKNRPRFRLDDAKT